MSDNALWPLFCLRLHDFGVKKAAGYKAGHQDVPKALRNPRKGSHTRSDCLFVYPVTVSFSVRMLSLFMPLIPAQGIWQCVSFLFITYLGDLSYSHTR